MTPDHVRVRATGSELRELWADAGVVDGWLSSLADLEDRLLT